MNINTQNCESERVRSVLAVYERHAPRPVLPVVVAESAARLEAAGLIQFPAARPVRVSAPVVRAMPSPSVAAPAASL